LQWVNMLNVIDGIGTVVREQLLDDRMCLFAIRALKVEEFLEQNWCRGIA
jgi:hypothetical protein